MGIEFEIEKFEKRLVNLASSIQENQEKRQAFLLTLISVLSGWEASSHLLDQANSIKTWLGWTNFTFYFALFLLIASLAVILMEYLFPIHAQKFRKKTLRLWKKLLKK